MASGLTTPQRPPVRPLGPAAAGTSPTEPDGVLVAVGLLPVRMPPERRPPCPKGTMYLEAAPPAPGAWTLGDTALALIWPCTLFALYLAVSFLIGRRRVRRQHRAEIAYQEPEPEPERHRVPDLYAELQVSPDAEPEVIEKAFHTLAMKYHPDVNRSPDATARMQRLSAAYDVLHDRRKRARYDKERDQ